MNKKTLIGLGVCALAFGAVIGAVSARSAIEADAALPTTLYLKPNANWKQANARFAAYFFNGESPEAWQDMSLAAGETDVYTVAVPAGNYPSVIFCRMNPGTEENNWTNKWNQTGDLTITEGKDLYTVKEDTWDGDTSGWGVYEAPTPSSSSEAPVSSEEPGSSEAPGSSEEESVPWYVKGTIGGDSWTVPHPLTVSTESLPVGALAQYEISFSDLKTGDELKITDGTTWLGYSSVENQEKVKEGAGDNIKIGADGDYKFYFKVFPENSYLIYVETSAVVTNILEDGYYLFGAYNGWVATADTIALDETPAEGVTAQKTNLTITEAQAGKMKAVYVENDNVDDDKWYGDSEGNDIVVAAGTYDFVLKDGVLTVTDHDIAVVNKFVADNITPYITDDWKTMDEGVRVTSCQEKYARAKDGYDALSAAQKTLFDTDAKYADAKAVYETWKAAAANPATVWNISHVTGNNTNLVVTLAIVMGGIVLAGGLYFVYRRRRSN